MKTLKEIIEHDLKGSVIHEAGHVVAALEVGSPNAYARIFRRDTDNPLENKTVGGQASYIDPSGKIKRAIIGYAGAVAVHLLDGLEPDIHDLYWSVDVENDESATDWANVAQLHESRRWVAFVNTVEILVRRWDDVQLIARILEAKFRLFGNTGEMYFSNETLVMHREHMAGMQEAV